MQLETLTTQMASPHDDDHDDHDHFIIMTMAAMKNCMKTLNHTMVCSQLQPALNSGMTLMNHGTACWKVGRVRKDSTSDSGVYEDYFCEMGIELFEGTQMITTDDGQLEVIKTPSSAMTCQSTCSHAFEGDAAMKI